MRLPAGRQGFLKPLTPSSPPRGEGAWIDPALRTPGGDEAFNANNLVCRAVRAIKAAVPELGIMCDVALDPYTSHGQDGLVRNGYVVNDETIEMLCRMMSAYCAATPSFDVQSTNTD